MKAFHGFLDGVEHEVGMGETINARDVGINLCHKNKGNHESELH